MEYSLGKSLSRRQILSVSGVLFTLPLAGCFYEEPHGDLIIENRHQAPHDVVIETLRRGRTDQFTTTVKPESEIRKRNYFAPGNTQCTVKIDGEVIGEIEVTGSRGEGGDDSICEESLQIIIDEDGSTKVNNPVTRTAENARYDDRNDQCY